MPVYNRNEEHPERPANYWLDYRAHGERIREPGCGKNERASERLLDKRRREIADGTWKHPRERISDDITVAEYAERHMATRYADAETATSTRAKQNVHDQEKRLENYVLPKLGARPLKSIERDDIKAVIADLVRAGELAPRTIHHVYDATRGMFAAALTAELILRTPCTLKVKTGELPKKRDKKPGWRQQAVFTHGELLQLFTDDRNPWDRRMYYALLFFIGGRFGEGAGRKWLDYDDQARPLGRMTVATQYDDQPLKGDGPPREAPVHPFLAWMLEAWRREGFALVMGRDPKPEDWIVPSRRWAVRSLKHMEHKLAEDLERIGLRRRTPHDLRASFITLAQDDGGEQHVLERVTHKGNNDVWSGYRRSQWPVLCDHVGRLRFPIPTESPRSHLRSHVTEGFSEVAVITQHLQRDGRDLKRSAPPASEPFSARSRKHALAAYAEKIGVSDLELPAVTARVSVELAEDLRRAADVVRSGRVDQLSGDERERLAGAAEAAAEAFDDGVAASSVADRLGERGRVA